MVNVGERIKKTRKAAGFTQVGLAKKIHMSQSYVANIENNVYNPSITTLKLIADALQVDIAEFVGDSTVLQESGMTNEEVHLLAMYRNLNDEDRSFTMQMVQRFNKKNAQSTKLPITGMIKANHAGLASGRA